MYNYEQDYEQLKRVAQTDQNVSTVKLKPVLEQIYL